MSPILLVPSNVITSVCAFAVLLRPTPRYRHRLFLFQARVSVKLEARVRCRVSSRQRHVRGTISRLCQNFGVTRQPVFIVSPLVFKGDRADLPIPLDRLWIFCQVKGAPFVSQLVVSRGATVAIGIPLAVVVNAGPTVGNGSQCGFFRRLFDVDYPPAILLSAYVPDSIGPRVFSYQVANDRFLRLVINGDRGATRDGTIFFQCGLVAVVQVAPVRRQGVRVCVSAFVVMNFRRFAWSVFSVEHLHCNVLAMLPKPRARAFVVFYHGLGMFRSRLFNRPNPLSNVRLGEVPLSRRFRPVNDESFDP